MLDLRYATPAWRKASLVALGAALTIGVFPGNSQAASLSLLANADAYVRGGGFANLNFGADPDLQVKFSFSGPVFHRKSYTRFDLSPITSPVLTATLTLTISPSVLGTAANATLPYTFHVYGVNDGALDNWVEGTGTTAAPSNTGITWNNAPANNTASGNGVTAQATDLGTFTVTGRGTPGQKINFSSAALLTFLNADANNLASVIIVRDTLETVNNSVIHTFSSRERGASQAPVLKVTFAGVAPEPGAFALMGVGLFAAGLLRRRRSA